MHATRRVAAALLAAGLALAACGSDDSGTTTGATNSPTTARGSSDSTVGGDAGTAATGAPASGDPVKVMTIFDESDALNIKYNGARAALEARIEQINGGGGIGGSGRPVQLEYCVTQLDPNKAADCARKAASDPSYVATVGSILGNGDASNPVLEQAGLANLGPLPLSPTDGSSPISFPTVSGSVGALAGMAVSLYDAGFKRVGLLYPDTPGGDQVIGLVNAALATRGTKVAATVQVPTANPDLSPQVTAAADGTDGVVIATDPTTAQRLVQTFAQAGVETHIAGTGSNYPPRVVGDLGDAAEGLMLTNWFATDDMPGAGIAAYVDAMTAAGKIAESEDLAKNAWVALSLLDTLASQVSSIDRSSILQAAKGLSKFDTGGFTPVIDFTTPGTGLGGAQPRFVNTTVVYSSVKDGKIVSTDGKFHDPFVPAS